MTTHTASRLFLILFAAALAACSSPTAPVAQAKPNDTKPWIVANHPTIQPEGR